MKRFVSLFLCVVLLLSPLAVAASAIEEENIVTIFVDGLNTCDVFNTENGEQIIPPSGDLILSQVTGNLGPILASVITGNYHIMEDELFGALDTIFGPMLCDENGRGINTRNGYQIPTEDEIRQKLANRSDNARHPDDNYIRFTYNWCESVQNITMDLRTLIERVVNVTGGKVALIGFSMGTCVVTSYLKMYDYEYVDSVVLLAGAYNGVSCCGEPFSHQIDTDSDAIVRFVESVMGDDATSVFLRNLVLLLNKQGVLDCVLDKIVWKLVDQLGDRVYDDAMPNIFARLPGLWCLVSAKDYPAARALVAKSGQYDDKYLAMLDWYHTEVQANMKELLQGCLDRGIKLGIVAKYGFANVPVIPDYNRMSDTVISSCDEAFGATIADVNTTLGQNYTQKVQNGHNCISPDNMIDASTCEFCEYTWFIKNLTHARMPDCIWELSDYIINAEEQPTVWDGVYNQFLLFNAEEKLVTLTAENDYCIYSPDPRSQSVFKLFGATFKSLFGMMKK